jgi:hypothetical protein
VKNSVMHYSSEELLVEEFTNTNKMEEVNGG